MSGMHQFGEVTEQLRWLLERTANGIVPGTLVTARPLDKLPPSQSHVVNLFLFRMLPHLVWGDARQAPGIRPTHEKHVFAQRLQYLVTVLGPDDVAESSTHTLLAGVVRRLQEHPVLVIPPPAAGPNDWLLEPVQLAVLSPGLEEWAKLWSTLQAPYRLSVLVEAVVILTGPASAES